MGRRPCCAKEGINRGTWTVREDKILTDYINTHGEGKWRDLPLKAGLKRCGKSCRLRWLNYLRPDIKRGNISPEEDELIVKLHKLLGNRSCQIYMDVFNVGEQSWCSIRVIECFFNGSDFTSTIEGSDQQSAEINSELLKIHPTTLTPHPGRSSGSASSTLPSQFKGDYCLVTWDSKSPIEHASSLIQFVSTTGSRWSLIAGRLPGRTDNEIKNYWHTKLSKINERQKYQNSRKTPNKLKQKESTAIKPTTRAESHKVIRTKAVRCTKPVLPLQPNDQLANINESLTCNPTESPNSTPTLVDQDYSSNFLTDFDISDLLISDVVIDSTYQQQESNDLGFHLPDTFEAMQRNSTDEALELKSIASFFDSEEEWINR